MIIIQYEFSDHLVVLYIQLERFVLEVHQPSARDLVNRYGALRRIQYGDVPSRITFMVEDWV